MTTILDRYFSFQGRLARVPFFVRGIQVGVVAIVLFFASVPVFALGGGAAWWAGVAILAASAGLLIASSVSLLVRRLHDIGLSGYHAIWVGGAEAGLTAISAFPDEWQWVGLPLLGVSLWVLFYPGTAAGDRFGSA